MTQRGLIPLALTQGDPSSIGPELALKAYFSRKSADLPPFFVLGDPLFYARVAQSLGLDVSVKSTTPADAAALFSSALPVVPLGVTVRGEAGSPDPKDAAATLLSIERAVECVARGEARAVVTNPSLKTCSTRRDFASRPTEFLGEFSESFFITKRAP